MVTKCGLSVGVLLLVSLANGLCVAQDCSGITKYGIFDASKTSQESNLVVDLLHWLSVNEYSTQQDAQNAAIQFGFVIPDINLPVNSNGTYGDNHSSSWSKAAADYLQTHQGMYLKYSNEFSAANSTIVKAWRDCVLDAKGLICWATQTDRQDEIKLSLEVRPKSIPLGPISIKRMTNSSSLRAMSDNQNLPLNTNVTPLLFKRVGPKSKDAANFTVYTNSSSYRCSADVKALPQHISTNQTPWGSPCIESKDGFCQACEFPVQAAGLTNNDSTPSYSCGHMPPNSRVGAEYRGIWLIEPVPGMNASQRQIDINLEGASVPCDGFPSSCWGRFHDTDDVMPTLFSFGTTDNNGTSEWSIKISTCQTGSRTVRCATSGPSTLKVFLHSGNPD